MSFPEGVGGAVVVLFGLGVEVDLQHFSNFLFVNCVDGELDGLPCNWSLIQGQEDRYPTGRACRAKTKMIGTSDHTGSNMTSD